jgi:acetoin utilization deacetylase AcuC-like enzyme
MLDAAICAFDEGIACAPVSGFHHARWDRWGGFCTFNGLMVTAISMLSEIPKVGILDCDHHYGDGTNDIIQKLKLWHRVRHFTYGRKSWEPEFFLSQLKGIVGSFADCGILLYQAGADPHENDPLGGNMSTEQLRQRDQIVFETCKRKGIPLVWNLAGGYQRDKHGSIRPVLDIHDNTMIECLSVYG